MAKHGVPTHQNKGIKPKHMKREHESGTKGIQPGTGSPAVEFRGTYVHAEPREGVTRPAKHNAGSHDSKIREHADHED